MHRTPNKNKKGFQTILQKPLVHNFKDQYRCTNCIAYNDTENAPAFFVKVDQDSYVL